VNNSSIPNPSSIKAAVKNVDQWSIGFVIMAMALCLLMPSGRSLWGDEGWTALNAQPESFTEWKREFFHGEVDMDSLKPLHGFTTWLMAQWVGKDEYALRLQNVIWIWVGCLGLYWVGRILSMSWLPLLFCLQPYVWHYVDEVRPYAMQIGLGAALLAVYLALIKNKCGLRLGYGVFVIIAFMLSGSSLLGFFPVAGFTLGVLCDRWLKFRRFQRVDYTFILALFLTQASWGVFYMLQLAEGSTGAKVWDVSIGNVAFVFYEFLGFSGMGPPRDLIRNCMKSEGWRGLPELILPYLPYMLILGAAWFGLGLVAWRGKFWLKLIKDRVGLSMLVVFCVTGIVFFLAAWLVQWPFWGRHLAPVYPLFVTLVFWWLIQFPCKRSALLILGAAIVFLTGSLRVRFLEAYTKDDFRAASQLAVKLMERGREVWWFADQRPARYYGLDVYQGAIGDGRKIFLEMGPAAIAVELPDYLIMNRLDVNDPRGEIRAYAKNNQYTLRSDAPKGFIVLCRESELDSLE
jgi:hypothetical protein